MVNAFETAAQQILAAFLAKQGITHIPCVNVQPHRTTILKYFILMNVPLRMDNHRWIDDIPVADFYVSPPKKLFPVRVHLADMPALSETLSILLEAAACADGTSMIPYTPESAVLLKDLTPQDNYYHINGKNHA